MKKLLLTAVVAFGVLCPNGTFSMELSVDFSMESSVDLDSQWNAAKSMTPALDHTIAISKKNIEEELVGKDSHDTSNQALVIMLTQDGPYVLMCKDYDLRKLPEKYGGGLRPTYGTLKASFGFGLPKNHEYQTSFDALVQGPANIALYGLFDNMDLKNVRTVDFVYSEGGKDWGPAVTIPLFFTGNGSIKMKLSEAKEIIATLNQKANDAFDAKAENDTTTGRFRDFKLIPLKSLLQTGSDQPVVINKDNLREIEVDGQLFTLWDENQMRKYLLPHVAEFAARFYDSL